MVKPEKQRARYVGGAEGAPPVPPPGGYHGTRRTADPAGGYSTPAVFTDVADEKMSAGPLSFVALVAAILFALVLLGLLFGGSTDILYGVTALMLQLVVLALAVAAVLTPRGRRVGASALAVVLLLNVATVGAASALQTSASGNYQGEKTEEQKFAEAYPGIKGTAASEILLRMPLETVRPTSEQALAEARKRLTARFGYTWVQVGDEALRPERNGYGGESMLVQYSSAVWATEQPVQDYDEKLEAMGIIEDVFRDYGMYGMYSFNDPSSNLDDTVREQFYGSNDPRTQTTWEWYDDNYPGPIRAYAIINDLSNDRTGEFATERQAKHDQTGEPVEGLQLFMIASEVLSDADRAEFQERMQKYSGY